MKKTSAFLIVIVLIMSVVVISFFGKSIAVGQFQTYMTDVWLTNEEIDANKMIYVEFDDDKHWASVYLEYGYLPADATYPEKIKYSLSGNEYEDEETGETVCRATVSNNGEVTFYMRGAVRAYIRTTDGSTLSDDVMIVCV